MSLSTRRGAKAIVTIDLTPTVSGYRDIAVMFIQDVVGRLNSSKSRLDCEEMLGTVVKISMYLAVNHPEEARRLLNMVCEEEER